MSSGFGVVAFVNWFRKNCSFRFTSEIAVICAEGRAAEVVTSEGVNVFCRKICSCRVTLEIAAICAVGRGIQVTIEAGTGGS